MEAPVEAQHVIVVFRDPAENTTRRAFDEAFKVRCDN